MRSDFDYQLNRLKQEMLAMGMHCEKAISQAAQALLDGNASLSEALPQLQENIKHREREIESSCLQLLLRQQPVARDLRMVSAALKMVTDLERIGDQAGDIAEIVKMGNIRGNYTQLPLQQMVEATIKMVNDAIDAFSNQDEAKATAVIAYDDVVDSCFDEVKRKLVEILKEKEVLAEEIIDLLMIAKYLERIGDHAVNVAGWVLFSITGQIDANIT
ncbi:MAG: phosphate signaling complex protein PhoU [Christensenellales bacterium]|jgi:phosphate transport system protein